MIKQLLADAANIEIAASGSDEPVLLGSAMLGAVAAGSHSSVLGSMDAMSTLGKIYRPSKGTIAETHAKRFNVFQALQTASRLYREI